MSTTDGEEWAKTPDEEKLNYQLSLPPLPDGWTLHPRTADHWLEVTSADGTELLVIKWDGCADYINFFNGARFDDPPSEWKDENSGYVHLCDLRDWLTKMQRICDYARDCGIYTE